MFSYGCYHRGYLSVWLSIYVSAYLFIYVSALFIYLYISLSIYLSIYLSNYLSIHQSFYLPIYPISPSPYPLACSPILSRAEDSHTKLRTKKYREREPVPQDQDVCQTLMEAQEFS